MSVMRVGFFRELRHAKPSDPVMRDLLGALPVEDVAEVARYLDAGEALVTTGSMVDDALDPTRTSVARLEIATDGEWVWPRDAAYYVREYRVGLPAEFLRQVKVRRGVPPTLERSALLHLESEFRSGR